MLKNTTIEFFVATQGLRIQVDIYNFIMWFIFNLQRKNKQMEIAKVCSNKYVHISKTDHKIEHSVYLLVNKPPTRTV